MHVVQRAASPELAPWVESLWSYSGTFAHHIERILPSATVQLLVNLDDDETRTYHGGGYAQLERHAGCAIMGPHTEHFGIDTEEQRSIVGINFRIGGALFFGASIEPLGNRHIDLEDVWGARASDRLRSRLLEAPDGLAHLDVLESALLERLPDAGQPDPIACELAHALQGPTARVGDVLARVGVGRAALQRRFVAAVGMTPKRFARVRRFHRVIQAAAPGAPIDWARVAADCGYFDQAHMIHDFRAFAGFTPSLYQPRAGEQLHVPLD